ARRAPVRTAPAPVSTSPRPPISTLFPYTTLFRSSVDFIIDFNFIFFHKYFLPFTLFVWIQQFQIFYLVHLLKLTPKPLIRQLVDAFCLVPMDLQFVVGMLTVGFPQIPLQVLAG